MRDKQHYLARRQIYKVDTDLAFSLDVFGDFLAEREGYKSLDGMACNMHIMAKLVKNQFNDKLI